jgi:hypothetical protein
MYQEDILPFNRQLGATISELIGDKAEAFFHASDRSVVLESHPFNLTLNGIDIDLPWQGRKISLLATVSSTVPSVNAMMAVARSLIEKYREANKLPYLRIINARGDYFFEIGSRYGIFICSGCTDYSGEGGRGRRTLEGLFNLLSLLWCVPIERVTFFEADKIEVTLEKLRDL